MDKSSLLLPQDLVSKAKVTLTLTELEELLNAHAGVLAVPARADFGERVRQLRLEAGYTTGGLGKLVGVASSTIRHWEHGSGNPSFKYVYRLAEVFHIAPAQLFPQVPLHRGGQSTLPESIGTDELARKITTEQDEDDQDIDLDFLRED